MTRPSNILVSAIYRNQRFRGATSSAQQNDFQAEVIRDITAFQDQWNELIVPLTQLLPDGTLDASVNAFRDGLDGRTLFTNRESTINTGGGQFFLNALGRPTTIYEQFLDVYNAIELSATSLQDQILQSGGGGGVSSETEAYIGVAAFNPSLQSSAVSIDGRSQSNQINILQLAKDMYGTGFASFSVDGSPILSNSVRAMVDALLELHTGNWDDDIGLTHSFSGNDITSGTINQEYVGPSSATGTGISDTYSGTPTHLTHDLNLIRTKIRQLKDNSIGWNTALTLNGNWSPVTAQPTDLKLLTNLKGSAARSNTNPWGYNFDDVDGNVTRLQASADYAGQTSLTDDSPLYSTLLGFSQGDSLTTAIGGLAASIGTGSGDTLALGILISGHLANFNNPHSTNLQQAASAGGFAPAGQITIVDSGGLYTSLFAEGALQEVGESVVTLSGILDSRITTVDNRLTTISGVLQSEILSGDIALDIQLTTVSGTLQSQISSNDVELGILTISGGGREVRLQAVESELFDFETSASFRRFEEAVFNLSDDSSITVGHSGGMYPQVQVLTLSALSVAGYNAGTLLPTYVSAPHEHPGILIEHSGVDNIILTNKLDDTLVSGIVLINW